MGEGNETNEVSLEKESCEREVKEFPCKEQITDCEKKQNKTKAKRRKMSERGETSAWNEGYVFFRKITEKKTGISSH